MDEILALPAGPLASAALSLAQQTESAPVADHSIRSFLFARLLAHRDGSVTDAAYDEDLLFASCVMHDLGLGTSAPGKERFEVEGADLAAGLLRQHDVATADIDRVWEAIAMHACIGIAHRGEGDDDGFLWRLNSYWSFARATVDDGNHAGLLIELEAVSLTRDVPLGLGWLIAPIIADFPRETLGFTLRSTKKALLENVGRENKR